MKNSENLTLHEQQLLLLNKWSMLIVFAWQVHEQFQEAVNTGKICEFKF